MPNEESFPIPLEHIDVVRRTNTTLDVLLESRIDDCWNVEGGKETIGVTQHFHAVHNNEGKSPPDGYMWSGKRLTKIQAHQGPIVCGQKFGQERRKLLNVKRNSIVLSKSRSSRKLES